jgi:hypothetical protein
MSSRLSLVLICLVLLLAGYGSRTEQQGGAAPADPKRVTLHVKEMVKRLELF